MTIPEYKFGTWYPIRDLPYEWDHAVGSRWHGRVLIFIPDAFGGQELVAQLDADQWLLPDDERAYQEILTLPTHFMPLPPPPSLEGER